MLRKDIQLHLLEKPSCKEGRYVLSFCGHFYTVICGQTNSIYGRKFSLVKTHALAVTIRLLMGWHEELFSLMLTAVCQVPFYGDSGLNAGVMHMDLARMRTLPDGWTGNPILESGNTVLLLLLLLLLLCHAQGTPPGFLNGLDWRALVED